MSEGWILPGDCAECALGRAAALGCCPRCGRRFGRVGAPGTPADFSEAASRALGRWMRGKELHQVAFYLACIPLFVAPPLLSLGLFAVLRGRAGAAATPIERWAPALVAAVLNLAISIYLLGQFADLAWSLAMEGLRAIRDVIDPAPIGFDARGVPA